MLALWNVSIFYGRNDVMRVVTDYKSRRGHTGANRQVFTPLHSNASSRDSSRIRLNQILYQRKHLFEWSLSKSKLVEYHSNPVRNTNVHEVHRLRIPSGTFTSSVRSIHEVHELEQLPSGTFTSSVRSIHEPRRGHMNHPFDWKVFTSNAN